MNRVKKRRNNNIKKESRLVVLMGVLKKTEIRKLTKEQAEKKVKELEVILLELEGEGKREKKKPVKKAIAQLMTYITTLEKGKVKKD